MQIHLFFYLLPILNVFQIFCHTFPLSEQLNSTQLKADLLEVTARCRYSVLRYFIRTRMCQNETVGITVNLHAKQDTVVFYHKEKKMSKIPKA